MEEEVYARWKEVEGKYISAFGKTVERALADHGVDRFEIGRAHV